MDISWFRDLVICVFGLGATIAVIVIAVLAFMFCVRVRPVIDSLKATMKTVENISQSVEEEVARPLAQVAVFFQGVRQAITLVRGFTRNREDD